jgi:CheY-like chemotaxis protein
LARKILLADDSVTAQNMGRKILTDAGYEVITVNNGSAALKKIAEHKPDLIVLDVYMPGYSGLEVCQRIKENKETTRIPILLTVGKLEPFKPEEARRARADAFVVKPFEASELLSALTKLEDKIVPQPEPYKQGRFAKAMAAADSDAESGEKFGDTDGGWKARLRIPTGSRKSRDAEPDVEYAATQGKGVRDVDVEDSDNKPKTKATEPQFERPIPAGLPHDITPEEIAAITAAAAQLSGATPAPAVARESARTSLPEAPPSEPIAEESAPVTFASSPALEPVEQGASVAQVPRETVEAAHQTETPAVAVEASEVVASTTEAATVNAAPAAQEESSEAAKPEQTFQVVQATYEPPQADAVQTENAQPQVAPLTDAVAPEVASATQAPTPDISNTAQTSAAQPVETSTTESEVPAQPTPPPPADDEFMTALQSLMPTSGNGSAGNGSATPKEEDMPPALAAIVAEVDSRMLVAHPAGPRWIAEEVTLAASEATLSLQKEMEQAYAAFAAGDGFRASAASSATAVSQAAVTIAEAPRGAVAESQVAIVERPAVLAMAAAAAEAGAAVAAVQPQAEEVSVGYLEETQTRTEEIHENVIVSDAVPEPPAQQEPQAAADSEAPVIVSGEVAAAPTETDIVGGTEDMAANWKNIRDSIAGAAPKPAVAKEEIREIESVKPEVESVAAAPESTPTSGAADPRAIANIVDSVLAELRPKIVEEIAKKLADPKKS